MAVTSRDDRLRKGFAFFDANSNGTIAYDDVIAMAARITKAFDVAPDSPKARDLNNGFELFWNELVGALDLDGDRRISPDEYRAGMVGAFGSDGGFARGMRPVIAAVIAVGDTDDDGVLDQAEFDGLEQATGTAQQDSAVAFEKLDIDATGTLTADELTEAAQAFYTGADPDARGNWLFGPV